MTDKTRLILTGLTLGVGFAMTACTGDSLMGLEDRGDGPRELTIVSGDPFDGVIPDGSDSGASKAPDGLEIR